MSDRICYYVYLYALPHRWQFTRLGFWLLERAGRYAYADNDARNAAMTHQHPQADK